MPFTFTSKIEDASPDRFERNNKLAGDKDWNCCIGKDIHALLPLDPNLEIVFSTVFPP